MVAHGMGQQVPFETIDGLARGLRREDAKRQGKAARELPPVSVGFLKEGEQTLPRAELEIAGTPVDLFEVYWAPVTQGKVFLRDVVYFLIDAGLRGLRNAGPNGAFERWMFGKWQQLPLNALATRLFFLLATLVFLALLAINAVTAVVAAIGIFGPAQPPAWLTHTVRQELTTLLTLPALAGAGLVLGYVVRDRLPRRVAHALLRLLVDLTVAAVLLAGALIPWVILLEPPGRPQLRFLAALASCPAYQTCLWLLIAALSAVARWFILEYVGDVAVYISAHTVNRYSEIRKEIQKIARETGRAVYAARGPGDAPLYHRVIVVGHSLGSVVAYDMLNALTREDLLSGAGLDVTARTPLLLTFGSPLDKTAYIFRTQQPREAEVREALAAAMQPLIASYRHRPRHWINLWSPDDWISGELNFYDERGAEHPSRVINHVDPDAFLPGAAHNQYWDNPLLLWMLYQSVGDSDFDPNRAPWPKK